MFVLWVLPVGKTDLLLRKSAPAGTSHVTACHFFQFLTRCNCCLSDIFTLICGAIDNRNIAILNLEVFGFVLDVHSPIVWKLALIPIWEE